MKKYLNSALKNEFYFCIILFASILFSFSGITTLFAQWESCNNGITDHELWCFMIDGKNTYVGIDGGVFLTTDNGDHWIAKNKGLIGSRIKLEITSLAINGNNIYAGTSFDGIFLSTDKGDNWLRKSNGLPYFVNDQLDTIFFISRAIIIIGNNIYATNDGVVYLSTNQGDNWTAKINGLSRLDTLTVGVGSMAASSNNIFAGTQFGVYMTTNNGENWLPKNDGLTNLEILSLAINDSNIYAGTRRGLFLSTDNGENWKIISFKDTSIVSIFTKGNNIFVGTGWGVYFSTDNGKTWFVKNTGLMDLCINIIIINGDYIFVGTCSHGIFRAKLSDLGITDVKENEQISNNLIYPNPASNLVKLKMKEQPGGSVHIQIIDLFGRTVYKSIENCAVQLNEKTIDCSGFPNGFYSVIVSYDNKIEYLRMVINK